MTPGTDDRIAAVSRILGDMSEHALPGHARHRESASERFPNRSGSADSRDVFAP
jgi:hypothetical protein